MALKWCDRIRSGISRRINRLLFNYWARGILKSPPVVCNQQSPVPLAIVSMVSHNDLYMYLLAIKTFYSFLGWGKVFILNDGTLTKSDINIITRFVEGCSFVSIDDVRVGNCPKGGCWERLSLIIELSKNYYVIQLDSDTLTLSELKEVKTAIENGESFALPTLEGKGFLSLEEIYEIVKDWNIDFVQVHAEKRMREIPLAQERPLQYIRANAAFAGFAKGNFDFGFLERFSMEMEDLLGKEMWRSWGSEQVASNFMIANSPKKTALPYPKYAGFYPDKAHIDYNASSFLHFIGTQRYKDGFYIKCARKTVRKYKI